MKGFLLLLILLVGCSPEVQQYYKLVPGSKREMQRNPHGAYILAFTSQGPVAGEYLGRNAQGIYILTLDAAQHTPFDSLTGFRLTLTRNRSREFLVRTGMMITPSVIGSLIHSEWAGGFLTVAVVAGVFGGVASLIESERDSHVINYPGDVSDITQLDKYARFPAGVPEHIDPMEWALEDEHLK